MSIYGNVMAICGERISIYVDVMFIYGDVMIAMYVGVIFAYGV